MLREGPARDALRCSAVDACRSQFSFTRSAQTCMVGTSLISSTRPGSSTSSTPSSKATPLPLPEPAVARPEARHAHALAKNLPQIAKDREGRRPLDCGVRLARIGADSGRRAAEVAVKSWESSRRRAARALSGRPRWRALRGAHAPRHAVVIHRDFDTKRRERVTPALWALRPAPAGVRRMPCPHSLKSSPLIPPDRRSTGASRSNSGLAQRVITPQARSERSGSTSNPKSSALPSGVRWCSAKLC